MQSVQVQVQDGQGMVNQPVDHRLPASAQRGPSVSEDDPKYKSDIEKASIISQLTFAYVGKVIKKAFLMRKSDEGFEDSDLTTFPYKRRGDVLEQKFKAHLAKQKAKHPNKTPSLSKAVVAVCWWDILRCLIIAIMFSFLRVFIGWIVKKLIDSYSGGRGESYKWSGGLAGALIIGFFLEHHYNHIGTYFPIHIRGGLVSLIYDKTTKLSLYTLTKVSPGQVINLASNDVNVFDEFGVYFPKLLAAPFLIIAAGALLWIYWGVLCLVGLGYVIMWFPFQGFYIVKSEKHTEEKNKLSDDRVKLTSESIEGIRLLKMYAWEIRFKSRITDIRNKETSLLKKELIGESIFRAISFSSLGIASYLIFMPSDLVGHEITAGKVFSTYYLFAFIRLYGAFFVNQGLLFLVQSTSVLKKIERILDVPEMGDVTFEQPIQKENAIEFDDFTGYWTKNEGDSNGHTKISIPTMQNLAEAEDAPDLPTLSNISVNIKKNSLNALVGTVGSGKTSFLMSLTGEMPKTTGALRYKGSIAYIEQEPTIFAGTFRDSICFGKPYDPEFYARVIKACCLETDLSLFPKGDMSEIGEKGNNLSGGQKARLALARGVYADADIYLLDDPLSAVDPKVAKLLFEGCIAGILKNKTRILVTHQVDFAKSCDHVMMIEDGRIIGSGPFHGIKDHELPEHPREIERIRTLRKEGKDVPLSPKKQPSKQGSALVRLHSTLNRHASDHQQTINTHKKEEAPPVDMVEQPAAKDPYPGTVGFKSIINLLWGMGNPVYVLTIFALYVMVEMNNIGYGILLGEWVDGGYSRNKSLAILGGMVGFYIFIYFLKYILLNVGLVRTTKKHHEKMLDRVIQAPVYFFDSNSVGQILNRFSNDAGTLDRFLPLITMDVLDNVLFILSVIITVSILDPVHLAPLAGEVIFVGLALWICFQGVKLTKKYELSTKGPLFGLFGSSLSGIVIIRSYGQSEYFKEKFKAQLHTSLKGSIGFALTARFLAFFTDFGYNLAEIAVIFIITARNHAGISPSHNGFTLALIISVSGVLQYTLRQVCMSNILLESSARIQAYWNLPQEPALQLPKDQELKQRNWPEKGDITFNQVFMKYSPTGPHVIKNLTLHAEAGKRIGCVGRTGAGKTSILQLLFRLQGVDKEKEANGYIKIDDVDINEAGLHQLRENISIIPQMPFILTGTVRYNIDPLGKATDAEIWQVLEDVKLREHVERLPQKLDTPMTAATSVFSVGQKQLVCLGRSILKPANIMIMDEATANMDQETDNYVTNKIRQVFTNSTTFTIAHRLATIANYDKVLVLDKGQIKEFDEPYKLLVKSIGDNGLTNEQGHFTSMVNNTGPITSMHIFQIAQTAYYERHPEAKKPVGGLFKDQKKGGDNSAESEGEDQASGASGTTGDSGKKSYQGAEARVQQGFIERNQDIAMNIPAYVEEVELEDVDETPANKQSTVPYDFHAGSSSKF